MTPVKGQTALAWIVVLTLVAGALLFIIVSAFSQNNARTSIDGDRSTYSKHLDDADQ